ncbi:class I SAM-dependent methyltransferase [Vulcanococcus limneticus]|uniref:class I SAM-dependent methyltransferase n=1 Tax=Vulcanococcus limneticus TaxID=2170428 RepID=UPI00398C20A2
MRKASYAPLGSQESFIVPLLAKEIARELRDIAFQIFNDNRSREVAALDCGCGNQPFRAAVLEQGFQYESLDVCQNSFNNVDYLCTLDCSNDQFRSVIERKYSLVLATEVLEHVSDWHAAFANIASCVEPGGYVLLTAPFFYPLHEEPYDYCRPTVHQFEKVSRAAGLEVCLIKKLGNAVDVIGTILGAANIRCSSGPGPIPAAANRVLLRLQKLAFTMLLRFRDRLESDCKTIYLSNIVVLRKPSP